jgi:hypothetical protein
MMIATRSGPAAAAGVGRSAAGKAIARATSAIIEKLRILILYHPHLVPVEFRFYLFSLRTTAQSNGRSLQNASNPAVWNDGAIFCNRKNEPSSKRMGNRNGRV